MGFDDQRKINTSTVNPNTVGEVSVASGAAAWNSLAKEAGNIAVTSWGIAEEKDKALGTQLGANAFSIDENGNISRDEMSPDVSTQAGQDAFLYQQNTTDLNLRQNALRSKVGELASKYNNVPNGASLFAEDYQAYTETLISEAVPSSQKGLAVSALEYGRTGVATITANAEKREFEVKQNIATTNISGIMSDITENSMNGRDIQPLLENLKHTVDTSVSSGFLEEEQRKGILRQASIMDTAGKFFKKAIAGKSGKNLASIHAEIKEQLYGKDQPKAFGYDDEGNLVNPTLDELDKIMQKVESHINHIQQNFNIDKSEQQLKMSQKLVDVSDNWAKLSDDKKTMAALDEVMDANYWTTTSRKNNSVLQAWYSSRRDKILNLRKSDQILAENTKVINALSKVELAINADEVEKAYNEAKLLEESGAFKDYPNQWRAIQNTRIDSLVKIKTVEGKSFERSMEEHFNALAISGKITTDELNMITLQKHPKGHSKEGQPTDVASWVRENRRKIKGYVDSSVGETADLAAALARHAIGFTGKSTDKKDADDIINHHNKIAAVRGSKMPFDSNTPEGRKNLLKWSVDSNVMPTEFSLFIENGSNSRNSLEAFEATKIYQDLRMSENGRNLEKNLKSNTRNRLEQLVSYFENKNPNEQEEFNKYYNQIDPTNLEMQSRNESMNNALTDNNFLPELIENVIHDATEKELANSGLGVEQFMKWAYYSFAARDEPTSVETLVSTGVGGSTPFLGGAFRFNTPKGPVLNMIKRSYKVHRPNFLAGERGDVLAVEEAFKDLSRRRAVGPTNYPGLSERYIEGNIVPQNNKINFAAYPIENYFSSENSDLLVKDIVRESLKNIAFDPKRDMPPVVRAFADKIPFDTFAFNSLFDDGYIKLIPNINMISKDAGSWDVVIDDPTQTSRTYVPLIIKRNWQPTNLNVVEIKNALRINGQ